MHILTGIILILVVVLAFFLLFHYGVFNPFAPGFLPAGFYSSSTTAVSNNSPYYQEVQVHFASLGAGLSQPQVLSLGPNFGKDQGITITGWTITTGDGTYTIPKVTNLYSPSVPGVAPETIYVDNAGDTVNFYSGKNPVSSQPQAIRASLTQWEVFLGADFLPQHGTITLKDQNGKMVSTYTY